MPLNPTTEEFMAKAAKKQKRTQRSKAKPKRAVALRSTSAALRKKSNSIAPAMPAAAKPFLDTNPAMAMSRSMSEIMSAFVEFPARLTQCRTPFALWREQALFAGRLFDLLDRDLFQERPPKR